MSNSRFRIWEDIATILRAEIASGQWQPDAVLPPQKELARRFGVQTQTIGKALQQLTAEGLLYAPHGLRERRVTTARAKSHRAGDFLHDPTWTNPRLETARFRPFFCTLAISFELMLILASFFSPVGWH